MSLYFLIMIIIIIIIIIIINYTHFFKIKGVGLIYS